MKYIVLIAALFISGTFSHLLVAKDVSGFEYFRISETCSVPDFNHSYIAVFDHLTGTENKRVISIKSATACLYQQFQSVSSNTSFSVLNYPQNSRLIPENKVQIISCIIGFKPLRAPPLYT